MIVHGFCSANINTFFDMTKCFVQKYELFLGLFGGFRIIHYLCSVKTL